MITKAPGELYPKFKGKVLLRPHPTRPGFFMLVEPLEFWVNQHSMVIILSGTLVNGASIPWIAQLIYKPFHPDYMMSSILHDACVGEGGQRRAVGRINGLNRVLSWRESAKWFRLAMKAEGCSFIKRHIFYQAVMLKKRPIYWLKKMFG